MIKLSKSKYPGIVYIEVEAKVSGDDAEKSEAFIKAHYGETEHIDALVNIKSIDGVEPSGMLKGMLLDLKHWGQFRKFAVVADKSWIKGGAKIVNFAPGINVKHFDNNQIDQAWEWLLE